MRKIVTLILFIFMSLFCQAKEVLHLEKSYNKEASKILYDYERNYLNLTPEKAYEFFGYRLSDARAIFYDLNSDGVKEVIGYIDSPCYWSCDGMALIILKKANSGKYEKISCINTNPYLGVPILDTKTAGFYDIKVYPTKNQITRIAKYNQKYKCYEYFFPN